MRRTPMVSHMCVIRSSWRRRTCLLKQREKQTESGVISIDLIIIIFPFVIMLMVTKHHFSIWTRNNQHSVFIKLQNINSVAGNLYKICALDALNWLNFSPTIVAISVLQKMSEKRAHCCSGCQLPSKGHGRPQGKCCCWAESALDLL